MREQTEETGVARRPREDVEVVQPNVADMATRPFEMQMHELIPRMELARKLRRQVKLFKTELREQALGDPASMVFHKPGTDENGKKVEIIGPSVRMAEIAARLFGNLDVGPPVFTQHEGLVVATVRVLDLETNVSEVGTSSTSLVARSGRRMPPHVIANLTLATGAKAFRNAITKIIGKATLDDLVGPCLDAAEKVEQDKLDAEKKGGKSGALWTKYVVGWAKVHITEADLLRACGIESGQQATAQHFTRLNGAQQAVKEGTPARVALGLEGEEPPSDDRADDFFNQQDQHGG